MSMVQALATMLPVVYTPYCMEFSKFAEIVGFESRVYRGRPSSKGFIGDLKM